MQLKISKIDPQAKLPEYAHPTDAGLDIFSNEEYTLQPNQRYTFSTGISFALPQGTVGLIWDKSGLASKSGLKVMGGVIDENYRGELKVVLHNLSDQEFKVAKHSKIAQMLVQKVEHLDIVEVEDLDDTDRGAGAFGSTGLK